MDATPGLTDRCLRVTSWSVQGREHGSVQPPRTVRKRFRVSGVVQGVGFRPRVYELAARGRLAGFVLNDAAGVLVEVEGAEDAVAWFRSSLTNDPPPLAVIDGFEEHDIDPCGDRIFEIRASAPHGRRLTSVAPDVATCAQCLAEMRGPGNRRHRYAFTNCANCGPRGTITMDVPYDRPNTTMAGFVMCPACKAEYDDPTDRRFHAQPIACPECGPRLRLLDGEGTELTPDPIEGTVGLLAGGSILAIKGLGGYHLACRADSEPAVGELRRRKQREEKPFAVMVPTLEWACRLAHTTPEETARLASRARPIVLLRRRPQEPAIAPSVAPGNTHVGLMLPYTPLHQLLLSEMDSPIVLTSGNMSDEPIAYEDDDALGRLSGIADAWLVHDRPIHIRCDDSVARVVDRAPYLLRRARGYAPEPLIVASPFVRPVLAAGPELKHTFCLGVDRRAIMSHHIGDLENYEAMGAFLGGVEHYQRLFDIDPEVVAHDLHPEDLATKWAVDREDVVLIGVQHHHAHIASCLADNGRQDRVIGLALDGAGWGDDETIWGCEVLVGDARRYSRAAHLRYVPLPGGAAAMREPWRVAAVYLREAFGDDAESLAVDFVTRTRDRWPLLFRMVDSGVNSPVTSSAGRLFDAVAALCGVQDRVSYEGQAAAGLEQIADPAANLSYPCSVTRGEIDGVELVASLAEDLAAGRPVPAVAAGFHAGLARALVEACTQVAGATGLRTVALSGGTWQNALLLGSVRVALKEAGFEVLVHRRVPANDGGVSLGQAVVANAVMREGQP
ncbi:carbamoyltransferase HypF [soil metagenome]